MPLRPTAAFAGACPLALLFAAALLTAMPADAQKRGTMRGLPKGAKTNEPVLTRDQLRQCVKLDKEMSTDSPEVRRQQALIRAGSARLDKLGSEMDEWRKNVDATNKAEIDSFNRLVEEQKALVEAHNAQLPDFNARLARIKAVATEHDASCAGRVYYEKDMDAIERGK